MSKNKIKYSILVLGFGVLLGGSPLAYSLNTASNLNYRQMNTKKCSKCKEVKLINEFSKRSKYKDGLYYYCKDCVNSQKREYYKTINGFVKRIYSHQREKSKKSNWELPNYTSNDLFYWIKYQSVFIDLWNKYKDGGYNKLEAPSCDRLDDYKPYSLDNLQIMTWAENKNKYHKDVLNGINTKHCKPITRTCLLTGDIVEYYSINYASRVLKTHPTNIYDRLKNRGKICNVYKWEYKDV